MQTINPYITKVPPEPAPTPAQEARRQLEANDMQKCTSPISLGPSPHLTLETAWATDVVWDGGRIGSISIPFPRWVWIWIPVLILVGVLVLLC